jgi:GT2 family glycosyltransferase
MIRVAVVMVAYGPLPFLEAAVGSALASAGVQVEVVLVDNGADPAAIAAVDQLSGVTVLHPRRNLGFASGCNLGVDITHAEVIVLFNCDAQLRPDTIAQLVDALDDPRVGIATASIRLAGQPERINSAGNPMHYLGLAWAGGHNEPADRHLAPAPVASASGACCALTRAWWQELDGFAGCYFAYQEDVELSIRNWQRGRDVVYVPSAVALHHYEFARNPTKLELLERNRLLTVLTTYSGRSLALLAPALAGQELAMLAISVSQGWWRSKLAGYRWLLWHTRCISDRHRQNQQQRCRSDREVITRFETTFEASNVAPLRGLILFNLAASIYRKLVSPWL